MCPCHTQKMVFDKNEESYWRITLYIWAKNPEPISWRVKSSILYSAENARLTAWHDGVGDRNGTATVEASVEPAPAIGTSAGDWNCHVPADVRMNGIYTDWQIALSMRQLTQSISINQTNTAGSKDY